MSVPPRRVRPRGALSRASLMVAAALLGVAVSRAPQAQAANLYWDINTSAAGTGGTGIWTDDKSSNWSVSAAGDAAASAGSFTLDDTAYFTGTSGEVTLSAPVTIGGLVFSGADFTVTGATLTLAAASGAPTISVSGGNVATLASTLSGSNGLTKAGNGVLRLTNATNSYAGVSTISGGALVISSGAALGADASAISILSANQTPGNTVLYGYGGGALVLDGTSAGFELARNINFEGRGPVGERSAAILSLGNNILSGTLTSAVSPLSPATFRNSRITSVNGTLTLSGTLVSQNAGTFIAIGGVNAAGAGDFNLSGVLSGAGSLTKDGAGVLHLNPSANSAFSGTIRVGGGAVGQQSSVRVTQVSVGGTSIFGANTGTGANAAIDMNGGVLELRSAGDLNFNALAGGKNVYLRASSTFFTGPALGGATINGLTTFGTFRVAANTTGTFNSRNGNGMTFQAWTQESSNNPNTMTNNMGGTLVFSAGAWGNNDSTARTLTINGNGNTLVQGSITASAANHVLAKGGTGLLTIEGVASTYLGATNVTAGTVQVTDFRSINNNTAAISLGNATTTAGNLIIGSSVAPTAAGLTTSKTITLNTTTVNPSIYANQSGANPVILNGAITRSTQTTGGLILGGTNTADNVINVAIANAGTGGLTKLGVGTWVLAGANTYTGTTTISNGVLKLQANASTSTILPSANAVAFAASNVYAGATLEFVGQPGVNNLQSLGTLTYPQGANTIKVTPGAGGTASLTFANINTAAAASVNIVGADFTSNRVTFTQRNGSAATSGLVTRSVYWNGADFAYSEGAVLRAPVYGVDANTATTVNGPLTAGSQQRVQGVAALSANTSVSTLKLDGDGRSLGGAFTLTLSGGGLLSAGGANSVATTTLALGSAALVVRVNDGALTVASAITGTGGLTKSGPGVLVLSGANAQTGTVNLNEGVIRLAGSGRLGAAADLTLRQGAAYDLNGVAPVNAVNALNNNGVILNGGSNAVTLTVGGSNGEGTSYGSFQDGAGILSIVKTGSGAQNWLGISSHTGVTNIGGSALVTVQTIADIGQDSGLGRGDVLANAASLVFSGTSAAGVVYQGNVMDGLLTVGALSATTNRLFTLAGTAAGSGATISSTAANNNGIVWSNFGDILFGAGAAAQTLVLRGTSTGDNTFNPRLTDNGANRSSLTKADAGQWNLGNSGNAYTGVTSVGTGVLALNVAGSLPANSPVVLGATTTAGTLQASGVFARDLATTAVAGNGTITWGGTTGGGGFAAHAGPLTVTLNAGAGLTWGSGGFVGTGGTQTLFFGSASALADVTFTNPINFGSAKRTINVVENANTGADFATLTGVLSGDAGIGFQKAGNAPLRLTGANTYTGVTDINAGTLVVTSLGSSTGASTSSVGASGVGVTMDNANAVTIGNASTSNAILQYVGPGETSDRKIRINATTGDSAGAQIHADGTGPLILTNVSNDMVNNAAHKNLWLRGTSPYVNLITSQLSDNGGQLRVNVDGGTSWVLTNASNSYTGTTTVGAGALGIGHNSAVSGPLTISNGNVFAHGADRTYGGTLTLSNNASSGFFGDYGLTFSGTNNLGASANNLNVYNSVVAGKSVVFNGLVANSLTANRAWALEGSGETVINGNFTTSTAFGVRIDKGGDGTLVLGTSGSNSNWNQSGASAVDLDRGTLRFSANEAIPSAAASVGLTISPEVLTADIATVDLNGTTQTVNALTATTDGTVVINNTSASAASFRFGANDATVNFGSGAGVYSFQNTGSGALSLVKLGNTNLTFGVGVALANKGEIAVEVGSFTVAGQVTAASGLRAIGASTLALTGGITNPGLMRSVEVGAGSTLTLLDGAGSNFAGLTDLRLGDTGTGTASLSLNVGTGVTDTLRLTTGGTLALGATVTFNLTDAGLDENATYTLLELADGGITAFGTTKMVQGAVPGGFDAITWLVDDNRVQITTGNLITGTLYWRGVISTVWNGNVNNWSTDKAGATAATSFPGAGTDVVFSHNGASGALTTTLEQNYRLNSLTFESGTSTPTSVTINTGTNAASRLEVSDFITLSAGAPASVTLGTAYKIGGAQTWTVTDAATTLTLGGTLLGGADVTKAGAGKVVLAAAADATFNVARTLDLTIVAGSVEAQNVAALGSLANDNLAAITVSGGAFFYANATAGTVPNPITLAGGSLSGAGNNHTYSGALVISAASTINMRDLNSAVTSTTARNITLSGILSGSGAITVDSIDTAGGGNQLTGNLVFNNVSSTWNGALNMIRGGVFFQNVAGSGTATPYYGFNGTINFNQFGRVTYRNVDGATLSRTEAINFATGAVGELSIDNTSATLASNYTVTQAGAVNLASGSVMRVTLDAGSALDLTGGIVLSGNASISTQGGAGTTNLLTISGTGISGTGNLAINDEAGVWNVTSRSIAINVASTFTGNTTLNEGSLILGHKDALSSGSLTITGGSTLRASTALTGANAVANALAINAGLTFAGNNSLQLSGAANLGAAARTITANGAAGATLTLSGAISNLATADGAALTLAGNATGTGVISGGFLMTGDTADATVSGGSWTYATGTSRIGDDLTVTGATASLTLSSGLLQVRDDLTVASGAVLNLNAVGGLSFSTATLSADASLRANAGGTINLGANNAVVVTDFDGIRIGVDVAGVGTLNMGAFSQTVSEFLLGFNNSDRIGNINGTGTLTVTSNSDLYNGSIYANLASTGTVGVDKLSLNTVTLAGDNSALAGTGTNSIQAGLLILDYTASNTVKLRAASALSMTGGSLTLLGNASAATSQAVGGLTLASGGSNRITLTPGAGQDLLLSLGTITRAAGQGTLRINLPSGTQTATHGVTTSTAFTGTIPGYLTINDGSGTYFASRSATGNLVRVVSTTKTDISTWLRGEDVTNTAGAYAGTTASRSINSLTFDSATSGDVTIASASILEILGGGILVTSGVTGGTHNITGGTLTSGISGLIFTQDGAATLNVSSFIGGTNGLTKTGNGTLRLANAGNNFTGAVNVQAGVLEVSGGNALGDFAAVTLADDQASTLRLLSSETIGSLSGGNAAGGLLVGTVELGSNDLTINHQGTAQATYAGVLTGSGTITRSVYSASGNTMFSGASGSGFTGALVVNAGLMFLEGAGTMNASSLTVNRAGAFMLSNNGTTRSSTRLPDTMPIVLNSADGIWGGQTFPSGLAIRTDQNAGTNETVGNLTMASGASYFFGTASGGTSTIAGIITSDIIRSEYSTIAARGRNLGGASNERNFLRIVSGSTAETAFASTLVGGGGAAASKTISILPWAIGETSLVANPTTTNMGNSLVTYAVATGNGSGLRPLNLTTEYNTFATRAGATDNIRESRTTNLTGLSGVTINSLVLNNSNTTATTVGITGTGAGQTLTVTSGALLFTATGATTGSPAMGLTLGGFDSGIASGSTNEYVVFVQNPSGAADTGVVTATISSSLTSSADLTKSGRGTLVLSTANTAGGDTRRTTLNEGVLQIGDLDNIGGEAGALVFAGGTLQLGAGFADDLSLRTISFLVGGGAIDTNGIDLALAGSLGSGAGGFTKLGAGNLTLNAAANLTGGVTISGGTLTLGNDGALGAAGPLLINAGATLDIGVRSLAVSTLTTAGASPAITGAGTITSAQGFSFGHTGDITIAAVLAGPMGLVKSQSSVLTLSGANTYAGTTEVTAGTLVFDSIRNVGGGASSLGAPTSPENGIIRMGLTTNGAGLRYTGSGHSSDRIIGLQGTTGTISLFANGTGALAFGSGARFEMAGNKTFTLRGTSDAALANSVGVLTELAGVMTVNKTDANTWVLTAANAYTGATQVDNGTLRFSAVGALPVGSALRLGATTTAGVAEFTGFDQTGAGLSVQSTSASALNRLHVESGRTLTFTGSVALGTTGGTTVLQTSGGGQMTVNNVSATGNTFIVGGNETNVTTADLSGLSSLSVSLHPVSGVFLVSSTSGTNSTGYAQLSLPDAATVTAGALTVGGGGSYNGNAGQVNQLKFGAGATVLRLGALNIGTGARDLGSVTFAGAAGTLDVRAVDAISAIPFNMGTGAANTAVALSTNQNTFDVTGHEVALRFSAVTIGNQNRNADLLNVFSFDAGTLEIGTLNASAKAANGNTTTTNLNIGGGTVTSGAWTLASTSGNGNAIATANFTGGSITFSGAILRGADAAGGGTATGTVNLAGATLDMGGFAIGSATNGITFSAQSGTLRNVGTLNGTGGLTKSGAGTLILSGANTFGGGTTISAGTLQLGNGGTTGSIAAGDVTNSATFAINRSDAFTFASKITGTGGFTQLGAGNLTLSGANDYTGATLVSAGTLTAASGALSATSGITVNGAILSAVNYNLAATLALDASATATISGEGLTFSGAVTNAGAAAAALSFSASTGKITLASLAGTGRTRFGSDADITGGVSEGNVTVVGALGANISGGTVSAAALTGDVSGGAVTVTNLLTGNVSAGTVSAAALTGNVSAGAVTLTGALTGNVLAGAGTVTAVSMTGDVGSSVTLSGLLTGAITAGTNALGSLSSTSVTGGSNSITGVATVTTVNGGTTTVGGAATVTTLTAGTLNLNGATSSIGTLNGGTINLGTTALTVNDGTFAGLLAGANGSLIKATAGTLTLSFANTFGGGTSINAGTLIISDAGSLGTGAVTVASGATLNLSSRPVTNVITVAPGGQILGGPEASSVPTNVSATVNTVITGTGSLVMDAGASLTLTTPNFYTGATQASGANAVISASFLADTGSSVGAGTLTDPTKLVLDAGAKLDFTGTTATSSSRSFTIGGSAGIAATGTGTLEFTSAAIIATTGTAPALTLTANNTGTNRFAASLADGSTALANLVIDGTGTWVLGGSANRFKNDVRIEAGVNATIGLEQNSLPSGATLAVGNNATLRWESGNTTPVNLEVAAGTTAKLDLGANTVVFTSAPVVTGTGSTTLEKQGSGTLRIADGVSAPTVNVTLPANSGLLSVNGTIGNVTLASGSRLGGSGTVTSATLVSGAILSPGNSPGMFTAGNLVMPGGSLYEWQVQNATDHATGYDKLSVTGNLDLTGASSSSRVTIRIVSLLGAGDGNTVGNPLNFGAPNGVSSIRTFQFGQVGGVLLNNGVNISDVFAFDVNGFTYSDGSASNAALWSIDWNQGSGAITLTAVPEPSTYGFGLGALALAAAAIRRRRKNQATKAE